MHRHKNQENRELRSHFEMDVKACAFHFPTALQQSLTRLDDTRNRAIENAYFSFPLQFCQLAILIT